MINDLKNPSNKFPQYMISKFREHAKEENIDKEFDNPDLIGLMAIENKDVLGFIVGYKDNSSIMLHYVAGKNITIKKKLLDRLIKLCKIKNISSLKTDTFEFMENNQLFKSSGFKLTKKEKLTKNLEVLWYELNLHKIL